MHSLESLSKMTWGQPLREDCWTAQRRAKASAWRGEQGLCILVHTCITLLAWSLAIAARAVWQHARFPLSCLVGVKSSRC